MKPVYFLSDLHLRGEDDDRTRAALTFLGRLAGHAGAVYLAGDVFDFWLGYRSAIFSGYFPVLRCLADLAASGTPVVLLAGNHDPDSGPFLRRGLGVEVVAEPLWLTLGERRVCLEHGDVHDPRALWRRVVNRLARTRALLALARAVHPDAAWALGRAYGDVLSGAKGYHGLPPGLLTGLLPRRAAQGADVLVLGHYHRAVSHSVDLLGRPRELFVLGDWIAHRTFLRWDGDFALCRDRGPGRPPAILPRGDHAASG